MLSKNKQKVLELIEKVIESSAFLSSNCIRSCNGKDECSECLLNELLKYMDFKEDK